MDLVRNLSFTALIVPQRGVYRMHISFKEFEKLWPPPFFWYNSLQIESYSDEMIEGHLHSDPLTPILLKWNSEVTVHLRNFRQSNGAGPINQQGICLPLSASGSLRTTLSTFGPQKEPP